LRIVLDNLCAMSVAEIYKSVSRLPLKDRAQIAAWLLDSLPPSSDENARAESIAEAVNRRQQLDSGMVKPFLRASFGPKLSRSAIGGNSSPPAFQAKF